MSWKSWISKKGSCYCASRLHIVLPTQLQRPITVLSHPRKDRRGGTNKAPGTFNILTLFHLVYLWCGGQSLDLKAQYISPYKPSQSLMFILGFLKSLYTLSLHCDFGSFEWTIISLEADGILVKNGEGEKPQGCLQYSTTQCELTFQKNKPVFLLLHEPYQNLQ